MNILVLGYYDRNNLGDEMFKLTLPLLLPRFRLTFVATDDFKGDVNEYDAVICGGGDIINTYFLNAIRRITKTYSRPIYAVGIGVSFESTITEGFIDIFDHISVRHTTGLRVLQRRLGSINVHYLPDLGFLLSPPLSSSIAPSSIASSSITSTSLPSSSVTSTSSASSSIEPTSVTSTSSLFECPSKQLNTGRISTEIPHSGFQTFNIKGDKCRVGICLAAPSARQPGFIKAMVEFINNLTLRYTVILIPFNTSTDPLESDILLNTTLAASTQAEVATVTNVKDMLNLLSTCRYVVAHRFHAHVFCTICAIPFVSISTCRKVQLFNSEGNYTWIYAPKEIDGRYEVSAKELMYVFDRVIADSRIITSLLTKRYANLHELCQTRQVENILRNKERRLCREKPLSVHEVYQRTIDMANEICGTKFLECKQITPQHAQIIAEYLCFTVTKTPGDKYVYGTKCNLLERHRDLRAMIEWIYNDRLNDTDMRCLNIDYVFQSSFRGLHRAGWHYVIQHLQSLSTWNGVVCDTYLDRTFHWGKTALEAHGIIPYTSPWVGFIHHTFNTVYSSFNVTAMFKEPLFLKSLPTCRALICLSTSLATQVRVALSNIEVKIPVLMLHHPTLFVRQTFQPNSDPCLVNVGAWYRNPFTIYTLKTSLKKKALRGPSMDNYFQPKDLVITREKIDTGATENKWEYYLYEHIRTHDYLVNTLKVKTVPSTFSLTLSNKMKGEPLYVTRLREYINECVASVEVIDTLDDSAYDTLFSKSVIFIHLIDCSAANTIIECIVRCTPIVVNRLPAVVEYLGDNYPLYYDTVNDIPRVLTMKNIAAAHKYLQAVDKTHLTADTFLTRIASEVYPLLQT